MNNQQITKAILYIRPNAEFSVRGETLDGIEWLDDKQAKPTDDEILAAIPLFEAQRKSEAEAKADQKAALLDRLGITEDEAKLLLT